MGLRRKVKEQFRVEGIAGRVSDYDVAHVEPIATPETVEDELVERAVTLLLVLPSERRETIEALVSPHDAQRGRAAVDALIAAAVVVEDDRGRLRRVA
jgi:hypothetical protein